MSWSESKWVRWGSLIGGIVLLGTAALMASVEWSYARDGVNGTAIVVAIEKKYAGFDQSKERGTEPRSEYRATYEYQDTNGQRRTGEVTTSGPQYQVKQQVPIQFLSDAPERSRVAPRSGLWMWLLTTIVLVAGIVLLAFGGEGLRARTSAPA